MPKKQKKQPAKSKDALFSNKKYVIIFIILLLVLILTLLQIQHKQVYEQHAATAGTCGSPGDMGNSLGVGKYCTQGGGQCQGLNASICSADIQLNGTGICSKSCNTDSDCGTGAVCFQDTLGKGCEPIACQATPTPTPGTTIPSTGCLGAGCPTISPTAPTTSTTPSQPTATPTPSGSGGGGNLLSLLLQFIALIVSFFTNLFKGL